MRIVGGHHRGRRLAVPPGHDIRPTADRVRESLFNILEHGSFGPGGTSVVREALVLDAFCGTGALGFEALSRGAATVTMLDLAQPALDSVRATAATLRETGRVNVLRRDGTAPGAAPRAHSLVFLDPPYGKDLVEHSLVALSGGGWLADGALVVTETGAKEVLGVPEGFEKLDERRYGAAKITLLRFRGG